MTTAFDLIMKQNGGKKDQSSLIIRLESFLLWKIALLWVLPLRQVINYGV